MNTTGKKLVIPRAVIIVILVLINILIGSKIYAGLAKTNTEIFTAYDGLVAVQTKIMQNYVEDVESSFLLESALKGMLSKLDPHCQFISASEYKTIKNGQTESDQSSDVGLILTKENSVIEVVSVHYGSPAYSEDILPGDILYNIDDNQLRDPNLSDIRKQLKGQPDSEVKLKLFRPRVGLREIALKRKLIELQDISGSKIIDNRVGYIKIVHFNPGTAEQLKHCLEEIIEKGSEAFVIDIRDNASGSIKDALGMLDLFVPEGETLTVLKSRISDHNGTYKAAASELKINDPVVFLVNEATAGGAEVVAAAIKGTNRGIVLGETTFGMAIEQSIIEIEKGAALKLTTGSYYTPDNEKISETGVEPHIKVEVSAEEQLQRHKNDIQKPEELETSEDKSDDLEDIRKLFSKKEKEDDKKEFVDTQLQKAVDILKALRVYYTAA